MVEGGESALKIYVINAFRSWGAVFDIIIASSEEEAVKLLREKYVTDGLDYMVRSLDEKTYEVWFFDVEGESKVITNGELDYIE